MDAKINVNEITASVDQMLKGLDGMVKFAEKATKDHFAGLGQEEAVKFAKQMDDMKFHDTMKNFRKEAESLKNIFNKPL